MTLILMFCVVFIFYKTVSGQGILMKGKHSRISAKMIRYQFIRKVYEISGE